MLFCRGAVLKMQSVSNGQIMAQPATGGASRSVISDSMPESDSSQHMKIGFILPLFRNIFKGTRVNAALEAAKFINYVHSFVISFGKTGHI